MDYGAYLVIGVLVISGVFFVLALYYRGDPRTLKFTSCGFAMFFAVGLLIYWLNPSNDLKIALFVIGGLSIIFRWFYRGALKDEEKS